MSHPRALGAVGHSAALFLPEIRPWPTGLNSILGQAAASHRYPNDIWTIKDRMTTDNLLLFQKFRFPPWMQATRTMDQGPDICTPPAGLMGAHELLNLETSLLSVYGMLFA